MPYLTQVEASKHLGISRAAVSLAWQQGRIKTAGFVNHPRQAEPVPVFDLREVERYGKSVRNYPRRTTHA